MRRKAAADRAEKSANQRPSSTRAAGAGGSSSTMLRLYTDESPGLKVDPVVVMTLSVVFIFSVVALHGDNDLKLNILRAIPQVFANASSTFVELDDVHSSANNLVRFGTITSARVLGITSVCLEDILEKFFRWVDAPVRGHDLDCVAAYVFHDSPDTLKPRRVAWDEERELLGDVHALEGLAGIGTNIVPWNLGPLHVARLHKKIGFGSAFVLLSRRGCRSRGDFFHALLGIVKADFQGDPDEDPVKATLKVATKCLAAGDYSPLLVVPAGYIDILAFGLQPSTGFPEFYPEFTFGIQSSHIKLEKIGTVEHAVRADGYGPFDPYISCMHIALQYTGPVVDTFV
ncbi:Arf guanine nucleotide exchange factor sbh1 [Paraconiothyrium brasiliense]|uniref:Arf guanine nucleotide exchange factor sbh1 n=1 Tax=Paraconiothyrium brasiliense TaxID=300254 RepID=A0ABR3RLI0_9PLEO